MNSGGERLRGIWAAFTAREDEDRTEALLALGDGLGSQGEAESAVQAAMAAVELAQANDDDDGEARAWSAAGRAHMQLRQHEQGRDCFLQSARVWEGLLSWRDQGHSLLAAHDAARLAGAAEQAEDLLQQAYTLLIGVDDSHAMSYAAMRLAQVEIGRNEVKAALELLEQARSAAGDDIEMVMMIDDVEADAHISAGDACCAVPLLWQALDLAESARAGEFPKYECFRLARAMRMSGEIDSALDLAQQGLLGCLDEPTPDADAIGCFHAEIGYALFAMDERDAAATSLRKARHHLQVAGNTAELQHCDEAMKEWDMPLSLHPARRHR